MILQEGYFKEWALCMWDRLCIFNLSSVALISVLLDTTDLAGNGSWETDCLLYTWVEMPVTYTGVNLCCVSMVGCWQQGLQGSHCKECPGLPHDGHSWFWALQPPSGISGKKYFKTGQALHMQWGLSGKHERNSPEHTKMREEGEKKRGAPGQEQRFSCSPWERPWWGMGIVWGGRSEALELLGTDSNPPFAPHPLPSLKEETEGEELGMKEWCGTCKKRRFGRGGVVFFRSVFIIVFVSYHSFQLLKHYINFLWVKSVLPVTVTGGQFSWPHLNPWAFSSYFLPCPAEQGAEWAVESCGWESGC